MNISQAKCRFKIPNIPTKIHSIGKISRSERVSHSGLCVYWIFLHWLWDEIAFHSVCTEILICILLDRDIQVNQFSKNVYLDRCTVPVWAASLKATLLLLWLKVLSVLPGIYSHYTGLHTFSFTCLLVWLHFCRSNWMNII